MTVMLSTHNRGVSIFYYCSDPIVKEKEKKKKKKHDSITIQVRA